MRKALFGSTHSAYFCAFAQVTVELNCSYMAAAALGDEVVCTGKVLRSGRKIGYTAVELVRARDGKLLAAGRHTKAL